MTVVLPFPAAGERGPRPFLRRWQPGCLCGVFKGQTVFGRDAEASGGGEEGVGSGLAARVIFGADEDVEAVEQADSGERPDDGLAGAAGDDGEGNLAVPGFDLAPALPARA